MTVAGGRYVLPGTSTRRTRSGRSVRLLPGFDQYVIAATRHAGAHAGPLQGAVYRAQGWISPVLFVDGHGGHVGLRAQGQAGAVKVEPFARGRSGRARPAAEAERLADFLGGSLELTWERA